MVKSWNDRLDRRGTNGIKPSPRSFADLVKGQPMLTPTARQVGDFIRAIPVGVEMDVGALRTAMAIEHGAEVTCPVTIGYHLRTVADAANEGLEDGKALGDVAPFWRVLDERTPTTKKLSFGVAFVAAQRKREGLKP